MKCTPEIDAMFDIESMLRIGMTGRALPRGMMNGIVSGAKRAASFKEQLCGKLAGANPHLDLLRIRTIDGEPRPLYRSRSDTGMNYYVLRLGQVAGETRIVDMYAYLTGENASKTLSEIVEGAKQAMEGENAPSDLPVRMQQIRTAMMDSDYKKAAGIIENLPVEMRRTKGVRTLDLQIRMNLDDTGYAAAIEQYRKDYPGDPSIDLISIDGFILLKNYAAARASVDRLDKRLDGDPYLNQLRAGISVAEGKPEQALTEIQVVTSKLPEIRETWYAQVDLAAAAKNYAAAVVALEQLEKRFQVEIPADALSSSAELAPIAASAEYKAWRANRPN